MYTQCQNLITRKVLSIIRQTHVMLNLTFVYISLIECKTNLMFIFVELTVLSGKFEHVFIIKKK